MNKMRQSNMELLRVFSMVIIVLSHYVYHGGLLGQELSINQAFAQFLKMGGKLGVTCFVLISAYYLIESRFKIQNIFKLMLQISFYAVFLIGIKFVMTGSASVTEIFKSILAPIYNVYWFPTTYIGMYLVFPLMNIIVNKYNENCLKLVIFLTVPFSIIHFLFVGSDFLYSNLTWFLYLYLWGGGTPKLLFAENGTEKLCDCNWKCLLDLGFINVYDVPWLKNREGHYIVAC